MIPPNEYFAPDVLPFRGKCTAYPKRYTGRFIGFVTSGFRAMHFAIESQISSEEEGGKRAIGGEVA